MATELSVLFRATTFERSWFFLFMAPFAMIVSSFQIVSLVFSASTQLRGNRLRKLEISLRVNLRHVGPSMAQGDLCSLKPKLLPHSGGVQMTQLQRMPGLDRDASPLCASKPNT